MVGWKSKHGLNAFTVSVATTTTSGMHYLGVCNPFRNALYICTYITARIL